MTAWRRTLRDCGRVLSGGDARAAARNNFLKEFSYTHRLERCLGHPQVYEIETTNRCPFTCVMCPRTYAMTRAEGEMDIGLFRDVIDQIRPAWQMDRAGARPLVRLLYYGEPFLYHHFADSIEYCHRRGFQVFLSSNPAVWTQRRMEEVLDTGVDELMAMVDGLDEETSVAIRGKAARFERTDRNIRRFAEMKQRRGAARPYFVIAMIKQPRNAHQWSSFRDYWRDIAGIDACYLAHLSALNNSVEPINALNDALIRQDDEQAAQVARQEYLSRFPCYFPWHSVCVTWTGEVVPCCRDYNALKVVGDLKKDSLDAIWNGPAMRALRREFITGRVDNPLCGTCTEANLETGLPGRYYLPARFLIRRMQRAARAVTKIGPSLSGSLHGAQSQCGGGYIRMPKREKQEALEKTCV